MSIVNVSRRGLIGSSATLVLGATINVPGDYGTIQAAVNAANNGDTVVVAGNSEASPKLYAERLTFRHQGRDHRLTDIGGSVVQGILG